MKDKQNQITPDNVPLSDTEQKDTSSQPLPPNHIPKKRILIVYSIFILLLALAAMAAWFYKQPSFLPGSQTLTETIKQKKLQATLVPKVEESSQTNRTPLKKPSATDNLEAHKLAEQILRTRQQLEQLQMEIVLNRARLYVDSAQQLIETGSSPERALRLLQLADSYITDQSDILGNTANLLQQEINQAVYLLQDYNKHSPRNLLSMLSELIELVQQQMLASQSTASLNTDNQNWIDKLFGTRGILFRVERVASKTSEQDKLLLNLLILARTAVLMSDQMQFYVALNDAHKLISVMHQPAISQTQIEQILSQKASWQTPLTNNETH